MMLVASPVSAQQSAGSDDRADRLRKQNAASLKPDNEVYRLPWDTIMERDILWKKRVWRDIDATNEVNAAFAPGANNLASVLLAGVLNNTVTAYDGKDDRFTQKADRRELTSLTTPDAGGKNISRVTKYKMQEDWLYVESRKKLVVRIVGLAPVVTATGASGEDAKQPLFWVYYPDAREYLSGFKATANANWDQLFQSRNFGSTIIQVNDATRPQMPE